MAASTAPCCNAFAAGARSKLHVPLPHRNVVLLGLALSYAAVVGARRIALAVTRDDAEWYASASSKFLDSMRLVADSLGGAVIETPLAQWDKHAVIVEGMRLDVDFGATYSCMLGYELHCGRCHQCAARRVRRRRY